MKSSTLLKRIALAGVASAAGFGLLRELDGDAVYKKQIQAGIMVAHRHAVATAMDDRFLSCFARAAAADYANARLWDRFAGPAYRALGGDRYNLPAALSLRYGPPSGITPERWGLFGSSHALFR